MTTTTWILQTNVSFGFIIFLHWNQCIFWRDGKPLKTTIQTQDHRWPANVLMHIFWYMKCLFSGCQMGWCLNHLSVSLNYCPSGTFLMMLSPGEEIEESARRHFHRLHAATNPGQYCGGETQGRANSEPRPNYLWNPVPYLPASLCAWKRSYQLRLLRCMTIIYRSIPVWLHNNPLLKLICSGFRLRCKHNSSTFSNI